MDRRFDSEMVNRSGSESGGGNNDVVRKSFGISAAGLATSAASLALGTSNGSGTLIPGSESTSFSSDSGSHSRFTCSPANGGCAVCLSTRFFLSGGSCNRISKADRLLTVSRFNGSFCCCCCVVMVNSLNLHCTGGVLGDNSGGVATGTAPLIAVFSILIWWIVVPSGNLMAGVASSVCNGIFASFINAGSWSIIWSAWSILALVCSSSSSSPLDMMSTKSIELSFRSTSIGSSVFGLSLIRLSGRVFCSTDSSQSFCDSPVTSAQTDERD